MNNKRRHTLCVLILIMTSLFLSSCGEPSLCTLSGIDITKIETTDDKTVSVRVHGTDTDLSKLSAGPGVILCYCFAKDVTFDYDAAKDPFAKLVKTKLIINDNSSILSFGEDNTTLYAFQKNKEGDRRVSSPTYCYDLYSSISGNSIDKTLTLSYMDNREFYLENNSTTFYVGTLPDTSEYQYIYIYAAFSAEQGTFSNNYWSTLRCLGKVSINVTE